MSALRQAEFKPRSGMGSKASRAAYLANVRKAQRKQAFGAARFGEPPTGPERALKADTKFIDTAAAIYPCNTTGSITHVTIVPQGNTVNQREGKAFRCTSVQCRGQVASDTTTATAQAVYAFVWDYQPAKALPALTDIWDAITGNALIKRENNLRFKIVHYRHSVLSGNNVTPATGKEIISINEFFKLPKDAVAVCTTGDATGVITNRISGALYFCTFGSIAAGTADANAEVYIRVNFKEK